MRQGSFLKTSVWVAAVAAGVALSTVGAGSHTAAAAGPGDDPKMLDMARRLAQTPSAALAPRPALAAAPDIEHRPLRLPNSTTPTSPSSLAAKRSWLWDSLGALALVLLAVFAVRALLRRYAASGVPLPRAPGAIEVLARTGVGPRQQVLLLKIGQRILVVGQTPTELSPLAEMAEAEEVAEILAAVERARPGSASQGFAQWLRRFHGEHARWHQPMADGDQSEAIIDRAHEGISGLLARVRNLKGSEREASRE